VIFTDESILDVVKFLQGNLKHKRSADGVEWSDLYSETVRLADRVAVHAFDDIKPKDLLEDNYPGESQEELDYRLNSYKNRTMPYWSRALGETRVIWNSRWSVDWETEGSEEYFKEEYPVYKSFFRFMKNVVHDEKFNDPNQVIAVEPYSIPLRQEEDEFVVDQTKMIEPYCVVYRSDQVVQYVHGDYFLALTDESSLITDAGTKKETGLVFKLYDQENIWKIKQVGNKNDWKFEVFLYYAHGWGQLPAKKLEGVIRNYQGEILYLSYFHNAVPGLDTATCQFSTLDIAIKKNAFPVRSYYVNECVECFGSGAVDGETCEVCHGSGEKNKVSPLKDIKINPPSRTNPDEGSIFPGIAFTAPGTEILEFLDANTRKVAEDAFLALNIDITTKPSGQTATETMIDMNSRHSFFVSFSSELFGLMDFLIDAMGFMRYSFTGWEKPTINEPLEYSMSSSAQLMEEIKIAGESGLPDITVMELTKEHLRQRFPSNTELGKVVELVFAVDSLATKTAQEIAILNSTGAIEKWQIILHNEIRTMLTPEILEMDLDKAKEELIRLAKAKVPSSVDSLLNEI